MKSNLYDRSGSVVAGNEEEEEEQWGGGKTLGVTGMFIILIAMMMYGGIRIPKCISFYTLYMHGLFMLICISNHFLGL